MSIDRRIGSRRPLPQPWPPCDLPPSLSASFAAAPVTPPESFAFSFASSSPPCLRRSTRPPGPPESARDAAPAAKPLTPPPFDAFPSLSRILSPPSCSKCSIRSGSLFAAYVAAAAAALVASTRLCSPSCERSTSMTPLSPPPPPFALASCSSSFPESSSSFSRVSSSSTSCSSRISSSSVIVASSAVAASCAICLSSLRSSRERGLRLSLDHALADVPGHPTERGIPPRHDPGLLGKLGTTLVESRHRVVDDGACDLADRLLTLDELTRGTPCHLRDDLRGRGRDRALRRRGSVRPALSHFLSSLQLNRQKPERSYDQRRWPRTSCAGSVDLRAREAERH